MPKLKYNETGIIATLLNNRITIFISNFIFQGILYMSLGEKFYKVSLTLFFSLLSYPVITNAYLSVIIGHALNYLLNGQFYVVYRYLFSSKKMDVVKLKSFLDHTHSLISFFRPLDVLYTGSFSKRKMSGASDLDIRIYHNANILSSISAYVFASWLRFYGLISTFPVDVYCFSDLNFLGPHKLNASEIPVHTLGHSKFLSLYPESISVDQNLELLKLT